MAKKSIMKLKSHNVPHDKLLFDYLEKSHYKTGSLFSHLLRGTAMICGVPERNLHLAQVLGLQLGLSFQVADDLIDVTKSTSEMKKDGLNDLREQNTTCPYLLYALQKQRECKIKEHDQMFVIIQKKNKSQADLDEAVALLRDSEAEQKTRELVHHFFKDALFTLGELASDNHEHHKARLTACSIPFLSA